MVKQKQELQAQRAGKTVAIAKWKQKCKGCEKWLRKGKPIYQLKGLGWGCEGCAEEQL